MAQELLYRKTGARRGACAASERVGVGVQNYSTSGKGNGALALVQPKSLQDTLKEHIVRALQRTCHDFGWAAAAPRIPAWQLRTWMTKLEIPH